MISFVLPTLISLALIIALNKITKSPINRLLINIVFISESIVLFFFFAKFPYIFALIIFSLSFYKLVTDIDQIEKISNFKADSSFPSSLTNKFRILGFSLLFISLAYEFLADKHVSTNGMMILSISFILIFYSNISKEYLSSTDFILLFLSILFILLIFPELIFKIIYGYVGKLNDDGWVPSEDLVYYFLGKPVSLFLNILGYNVISKGEYISFEDTVGGIFRTVEIAESCSGIMSVQVFVAALFSFLYIQYGKFDYKAYIILFFGILFSYISNLLRISGIILVGHYKGIEAMLFVHEYLGWLVFTFWLFIFWFSMVRFLDIREV